MSANPVPRPEDEGADISTGVSPNHTVQYPNGDTASFPSSLNQDQLNAAAHAVYSVAHDATSSAIDEAENQAKGISSLWKPPADAPADERMVHTILGPVSGGLYSLGKQVAGAVAAAHLANQQGEGVIGSNLELYRNLPVIGDLVRDFEKGKVTQGIATGLTRAALMKGAADLSSTALAKADPAVSAVTGEHTASPTASTASPTVQVPIGNTVAPVPMSLENRLAASFMRRERLAEPPTIEEVNPQPQEIVQPKDKELSDFVRAHFGSEEPQVQQIHGAGEDAGIVNIGGKTQRVRGSGSGSSPKSAIQQSDEDALTRAYLERLESEAKPSEVDMLASIRKRLGLGKTSPIPETMSKDTPQQIQAYAEGVKRANIGKPQGVPVPKVTTSPAPDGYAFKDAQIHTLRTSDGQRIGTMSTSPTDVSGEAAVRDAGVAEKYQNHGHSLRMYSGAADNLRKQGFTTLRSDPISLSPEAQRTWESLSRTEPITKSVNPVNGEPVYRWDLTQEPGAKQLPISKRFSTSEAAQNAAERLVQPRPSFIERTGRKVNQLMHEEDVTSQIPTE